MLEDGWSIRAVARDFGVNKSTILKIKRRRWEQERTLSRREGSGRHKISNEIEDGNLVDYARGNPFKTAKDAMARTNFSKLHTTACRRIRKTELRNRAAAKKMLLTVRHKQARFLLALNHINRDREFWKRVVFSEEKIFCANDGQVRVYRPRGTRYDKAYVTETRRDKRFSVNFWGWISYHGLGTC